MPLNSSFGLERRLVDGGQCEFTICRATDQLEDATPKVFTWLEGPIGLIKSTANIHAVRNVCPHKGAPYASTFKGHQCAKRSGTFVFR